MGGSAPEKVVAAILTPRELLELQASRSDHHTRQRDISYEKESNCRDLGKYNIDWKNELKKKVEKQ